MRTEIASLFANASQATSVMGWVERYGIPIGLLFVIGVAIWRIAKWAGPHVDEMVKSHIDMVESTKEAHTHVKSKLDEVREEQIKQGARVDIKLDQIHEYLRKRDG